MKILFITHRFYPYIGGIEVNSELLATEFQQAGHEIRLLTWTEDPSGKHFPFPVIRKPGFAELLRMHRWADVVYENNPSLRLSWPAFLLGKKRVVAIRTWVRRIDGVTMAWQDYLKLWWLKQATGVIAISEAIRRQACPTAVVIGNPYRNQLFKDLQQPRNPDFVFLGRLVSNKGADEAIKALALLHKKIHPGLTEAAPKLTIIGEGPERERLEMLVNTCGMADHVVFTGPLTGGELVKALNRHAYLLVPSLWEEPFGNVALEGMACGCLPVVSDGGGLPDAAGKAGLVFTRGDTQALAEAMYRLLHTPELEQNLRSHMAAHLQAHTPERVSSQYLSVIQHAVTGAART